MSQLRILTVANVPPNPNSGAAGTVYHTNQAFREIGHEVTEIWQHDFPPVRIKHGNLHALFEQPVNYLRAVKDILKHKSFDVVMMSQPQAYKAASYLKQQSFPGAIINRSHGLELRWDEIIPTWHRKLGIPESRFPRSLLTPLMRYVLSRQWNPIMQHCDGIILPSDMDAEYLRRKFPYAASKVHMVHHGFSHTFTDVPPELTPERMTRMLHVGQYSFFKGYAILIPVVNNSLKEHPHLFFTWITNQEHHAIIMEQIDPEIRPRVRLKPWLKNDELIKEYDEHGIFLFPSLFEGAGKASLEALSRRMLVIASDEGAMHDYMHHSQGGVLCERGNVPAFCQSITNALFNPRLALDMAERGYHLVKEKTWQHCAEKLITVFRTIIREKQP